MIDATQVYEGLNQMVPVAEENEQIALELSYYAAHALSRKLRSDVTGDEPEIIIAAIFYTLYLLAMKDIAFLEGISSLKIGDISIAHTSKDSVEAFYALFKQSMADASTFFIDDDFHFGAV